MSEMRQGGYWLDRRGTVRRIKGRTTGGQKDGKKAYKG